MYDPLLFSKEITVPLIINKVAELADISVTDLTTPDKKGVRRKREIVNTRQISMALSKVYTKSSLACIGAFHGGRDHATVLHACKTIANLIDTKDSFTTYVYFAADKYLEERRAQSLEAMYSRRLCFLRNDLIKTFIKSKIDLCLRMKLLKQLYFIVYDRYSMETLSGKLQEGSKRKLRQGNH